MSTLSPRFFALLTASAVALGCIVDTNDDAAGFRDEGLTCEDVVTPILAGQTINAGEVTVTNTVDALVISATSTGGWTFDQIHVYAGTGPVPTNNAGNAAPGQFPYAYDFSEPYPTQHSFAIPLDELDVACGDVINVAFHAAMLKLDANGSPIQGETGWGEGDKVGKNWAMKFQYTVCCDETVDYGCTLTQGYWGTHYAGAPNPSQNIPWPISEDTIMCGQTWLDILNTPTEGDKWLILAHQYIAAKLNFLSGAAVSQEVADAMWAANALLHDNCDGLTPEQEAEAVDLADLLDAYNNGIIGPGHCE